MESVRERLATEHTQALQRLADLRHGFDAMVAASRDTNADDEHDPEGATIAFERSQIEALVRQAENTSISSMPLPRGWMRARTAPVRCAGTPSARSGSKPGRLQQSASGAPVPADGERVDLGRRLPRLTPDAAHVIA
jgi:hypothetical protein